MSHNITPRQERAVAVLVAGGNDIEASKAAGVKRETVNRWKRDLDFQDAIKKQRDKFLPDVTLAIMASLGDCVAYLRSVVNDDEQSHTLRIRAAGTLLSNALKYQETTDILQRLEALEGKQ